MVGAGGRGVVAPFVGHAVVVGVGVVVAGSSPRVAAFLARRVCRVSWSRLACGVGVVGVVRLRLFASRSGVLLPGVRRWSWAGLSAARRRALSSSARSVRGRWAASSRGVSAWPSPVVRSLCVRCVVGSPLYSRFLLVVEPGVDSLRPPTWSCAPWPHSLPRRSSSSSSSCGPRCGGVGLGVLAFAIATSGVVVRGGSSSRRTTCSSGPRCATSVVRDRTLRHAHRSFCSRPCRVSPRPVVVIAMPPVSDAKFHSPARYTYSIGVRALASMMKRRSRRTSAASMA